MPARNPLKNLLRPLRAALYDFAPDAVRAELARIVAPDAAAHFAHPLGDATGPDALFDRVLAPLGAALPDLERREWIAIGGRDADGADWVGCGGFYCGTFREPWLGIPPTGHLAHMRFHEFFRIDGGRVVEIQALWDIPELMMQAGVWPMAPALGREWAVPGPARRDTGADGAASLGHVVDMLAAMQRHPTEDGPEAMQMARFWHPRFNWYGPAGIGTGRGVSGFRNWHQIPFLAAMPDRGRHPGETKHHFLAEADLVAVTGWPNMCQTLSGGGWLGLPPTGQRITLRSLDFWRLENGLIRENWVLVDLLDMYRQIGVDVLARMHEIARARPSFERLRDAV